MLSTFTNTYATQKKTLRQIVEIHLQRILTTIVKQYHKQKTNYYIYKNSIFLYLLYI